MPEIKRNLRLGTEGRGGGDFFCKARFSGFNWEMGKWRCWRRLCLGEDGVVLILGHAFVALRKKVELVG